MHYIVKSAYIFGGESRVIVSNSAESWMFVWDTKVELKKGNWFRISDKWDRSLKNKIGIIITNLLIHVHDEKMGREIYKLAFKMLYYKSKGLVN